MDFEKLYRKFTNKSEFYTEDPGKIGHRSVLGNIVLHLFCYLLPAHIVTDDVNKQSTLKFYNPFDTFRLDRKHRPPLWVLSTYLVYICQLIVSLYVAILLYIFAMSINNWKPQVRFGSNRTEFCALKENIYNIDDNDSERRSIMLHNTMRYLGFGFTATTNIISYLNNNLAMFLVGNVLANLYLSRSGLAFNALLNLKDPKAARGKMKMKSTIIVEQQNFHSDETSNHSLINQLVGKKSHVMRQEQPYGIYMTEDSSSKYSDDIDKRNFSRFIKREIDINLIRPECLSLKSIDSTKKVINTCLLSTIVNLVGLVILCVFGLYLLEAKERVKQRWLQLKCEAWHPNGTLIRDQFLLDPLDYYERQVYQLYDGSFMSQLKVIQVESKKLYGISTIVILFVLSLYLIQLYVWGLFHQMHFLYLFDQHRSWMNQLVEQLKDCQSMLTRVTHVRLVIEECVHNIEGPALMTLLRRQQKCVEQALTITYLNYELMLIDYVDNREFINFTAEQAAIILILNSLSCFITTSKETNTSSNLVIWVIIIIGLLIVNLFVMLCSRLTKRFVLLNKCISDVLAKASENSLELAHIVKLWRQRLLNETEIQSLFSIQAYGFRLTDDNLANFNASFIGFWLLANRSTFQ